MFKHEKYRKYFFIYSITPTTTLSHEYCDDGSPTLLTYKRRGLPKGQGIGFDTDDTLRIYCHSG